MYTHIIIIILLVPLNISPWTTTLTAQQEDKLNVQTSDL